MKNSKNKLTTEEFIKRAQLKHGDKYDYSKTIYYGKFKKLKINCRIHGEFEQEAWGHIKGKGCIDCSGFKPLTTKIFIEKAKQIHGNKYDYSKTEFTTTRKLVVIICPIHDEFTQVARGHLSGRGCKKCQGIDLTKEEFIEKAKQIHGNKYNYSIMNYDIKIPIIDLICSKHGKFTINRNRHINVGKLGCTFCSESKGEMEIGAWLTDNNVEFIKQKKFKGCKNKKLLSFDFYLPDYNFCIEYDGVQHFKSSEFFGGESAFEMTKKHDEIKNKFCCENDIKLLRIKFNENLKEKLIQNIKL